MSESLTLELRALLDRLCDEFESAWRNGPGLAIETLLSRVEPGLRSTLLRELLLLELELCAERGDRPSRSEYIARFPDERPLVLAAFRTSVDGKGSGPVETPRQSTTDTDPRLSEVRCPQCHLPTDVAIGPPSTEVRCRDCGHEFHILSDESSSLRPTSLLALGRFELLEQLGMGGFGTVWKAFDYQLERIVAVKVPRRGDMDADEMEKFLREARATAQLRHPNIVAVHEGGRDGNSVYIVTDFVEGATLSDWMASQRLSTREAAQLCFTIAEALHHAHQQGIIHRDLKPANILMDHDGQPHLTDFGLARRELGDVTMTVKGLRLGTPAYMSPEQARGDSHTADARSDVYSLGVVLFQLLTGELPFRGSERMLLHQVLHDDPPSPRTLNGSVPKDLETIALKCLEKDPTRRYATARYLAEELQRYMRSEPILARPISRPERTWRWSRRHPAIVAVLSMGVALLVTLSISLVMIYAAKRNADRHRQLAERRETTVGRTLHFLKQVFASSDPIFGTAVGWRQSGDTADLPLREVLNRAAPTVSKELLQDEPQVGVPVLCALGEVYRSVGIYDGAEMILKQAKAAAASTENAETQALADFHWGWLCHDLGRYEEARASYERARQLRVEKFSEKSLEVAEVDFNLAWLLADLQKPIEATALFRKVLDVQRYHLRDDSFEVQKAALALKLMLLAHDKADEAMLVEISVGERPSELITIVDKYRRAKKLRDAKQLDQALPVYQDLYESSKSRLNPGHPLVVFLQVDLAGLHRELGNNAAAEVLMREAINGSKMLFDSNPKLIRPLMEFARTLAARGDVDEAATLYQRALVAAQGHDPNLERQIQDALSELSPSTSTTGENASSAK